MSCTLGGLCIAAVAFELRDKVPLLAICSVIDDRTSREKSFKFIYWVDRICRKGQIEAAELIVVNSKVFWSDEGIWRSLTG